MIRAVLHRCRPVVLLPLLFAACAGHGHRVVIENASGAAVPKVVCRLQRADGGADSSNMVLAPGEGGQIGVPVGEPVRHVDVEVTWDPAAAAETFRMTVSSQHALDVRLRLLPGHKLEFTDAVGAAKAGLSLERVGG